jgi:hypothetical protein
MSGPKCATVIDHMALAREAQRRCNALLNRTGEAEGKEISALIAQAATILSNAEAVANKVHQDIKALSNEAEVADTTAQTAATKIASNLNTALTRATTTRDSAAKVVEKANASEKVAREQIKAAQAVLIEAEAQSAVSQRTTAAQRARTQFDKATTAVERVAQDRQSARRQATAALAAAKEIASAADVAAGQLAAVRTELEARRRALAEAQRVAQEARAATLAVDEAGAAVARCLVSPHEKFAPRAGESIRIALQEAQTELKAGRHTTAQSMAIAVEKDAQEISAAVAAAQSAFEARRAAAQSEGTALEGQIAAVPDLQQLFAWADDPQALEAAKAAVQAVGKAIDGEQFETATEIARAAQTRLVAAQESAIANAARDETRMQNALIIGTELKGMGYDVSMKAGTRDENLLLSGYAPNEEGRGDWDAEVHLDGTVHFEIKTSDASCIAAIETLRERLAARAMQWTTTDYGHATDYAPKQNTQVQTQTQTQNQTLTQRG